MAASSLMRRQQTFGHCKSLPGIAFVPARSRVDLCGSSSDTMLAFMFAEHYPIYMSEPDSTSAQSQPSPTDVQSQPFPRDDVLRRAFVNAQRSGDLDTILAVLTVADDRKISLASLSQQP